MAFTKEKMVSVVLRIQFTLAADALSVYTVDRVFVVLVSL